MIRRVNSTSGRAGVTLLELLIVMLIIATLASLVLSAVFTVRESQMKSFTETLVNKLASALDQQWKAAIDQIREEPVPNWALTMGGNDLRVAKVIYLKARLKQEFPVSFYQAIYPTANYNYLPLTQPGAFQTPGGPGDLLPKSTYRRAIPTALYPDAPLVTPVPPPDAGLPQPQPDGFESSALLYLTLAQGRRGQTGFSVDENIESTAIRTASITILVNNVPTSFTFKYFADSWGNPVRFWAFPFGNDELNAAPYKNAFTQNQQSPDPQDPDKTFLAFKSPWAARFGAMVHPTVNSFTQDLRQLVPVVGSIGRDGLRGVDYFDMSNLAADPAANDNIYSYRLRRSGQRGD